MVIFNIVPLCKTLSQVLDVSGTGENPRPARLLKQSLIISLNVLPDQRGYNP